MRWGTYSVLVALGILGIVGALAIVKHGDTPNANTNYLRSAAVRIADENADPHPDRAVAIKTTYAAFAKWTGVRGPFRGPVYVVEIEGDFRECAIQTSGSGGCANSPRHTRIIALVDAELEAVQGVWTGALWDLAELEDTRGRPVRLA